MPRSLGLILLIALALVLDVGLLRGQSTKGQVVDARTRMPIPLVAVSVWGGNTTIGTGHTDDSGRFELSVARPGAYTLRLRRIGYSPLELPLRVDATADSVRMYAMTTLLVALDTVVANSQRRALWVTPGREWVRRHTQLDRGQIVSGIEIQRSKLSVLEYLGTIPGLRFAISIPIPDTRALQANSPPTIPGRQGYLLSTSGSKCLYGRIDQWSIIGLLGIHGARDVDDLIEVSDIKAVEVFQSFRDIPDEWRADGWVRTLVWRGLPDGRSYLMGDTGVPHPAPGQALPGPRPPQNAPDPRRQPAVPPYPESRLLQWMVVPSCGFVQIWTSIAW
jgi:hypothetical protein